MVDSITPATDDALRAAARAESGLEDAWPIQREAFTQWVVEDHPALAPLAAAGVTLTSDVHGYEAAKLKLLNGPHSTLAYVGSLRGRETVADAMRDPVLAAFVERLMREDIAPHVAAPAGLDVQAYIGAVLERFHNPAIAHRLSQIAWDGSQKLPQRLIPTVQAAIAAGRPLERLAVPFAAWMRFVAQRAAEGEGIIDPLADTLLELGRAATGASGDIEGFLALPLFPSDLAAHAGFRTAVAGVYLWLPRLPD
jgi:fructuronate reductase